MSEPSFADWQKANRAELTAALAEVRWAVESYLAKRQRRPAPPAPPAAETGRESALHTLSETLGLSRADRQLLLLGAGAELDAALPSLYAHAQGDAGHTSPTFALALAVFPDLPWSSLLPAAPLRYWRLLEVGPAANLTLAPLRIDEFTLHYLVGLGGLDDRLSGLVRPVPEAELSPSQSAAAETLAASFVNAAQAGGDLPAFQLCGDGAADRRRVAAALCDKLGCDLFRVDASALPGAGAELDTFVRLWQRHALLSGAALLVELDDLKGDEAGKSSSLLRRLEEDVRGLLIFSGLERRPQRERPLLTSEVAPPTASEQSVLWQSALAEAGLTAVDSEPLVSQFRMPAAGIRAACASALGRLRMEASGEGTPEGAARLLWDSCRALARPRLSDLAERIEPRAAWDDLVLPEEQVELLRAIAVQARQRYRVYETWGFAARSSRGLGISALFSGPSGTGKTMAAEVLVGELGLDLYRIDLAMVVSKYIGETEKNLGRIFAAAEEGGAVLLFDEADALFGKRSDVKDSHDRYANVEVSYLLQRMESYRGLSILTTNLRENIDPAFLRRLGTVVEFPFPDRPQREAIWSHIFPRETPTAGLDADRLARLNVTGGHIRNMALAAAFLAADSQEPVGMAHLRIAARRELAKLGRSPGELEIGDW